MVGEGVNSFEGGGDRWVNTVKTLQFEKGGCAWPPPLFSSYGGADLVTNIVICIGIAYLKFTSSVFTFSSSIYHHAILGMFSNYILQF